MVDVSEDIWDALVDYRQSLPGLTQESPPRAAVLRAALRQAEELTRASAAVGFASRPILLYYAATQLSRALAAAVLPNPFQLRGHGLSYTADGATAATARARSSCQPKKDGTHTIFGGLLAVLDLPLPADGTSATLADAWPTLYGGDVRAKRPDSPVVGFDAVRDVLTRRLHDGTEFIAVTAPTPWLHDDPAWADALRVSGNVFRIGFYLPRELRRWIRDGEVDFAEYLVRGYPGVVSATPEPATEPEYTLEYAVEVEPSPRARGEQPRYDVWVPAPSDMPQLGSRLPAWWFILFICGSLARYEPGRWGAMIDENTSPDAVALREAMRVAVDDVPRRFLDVFRALDY